MNQKLKQREIGKIPDDWEVVGLKEICELIRGTEPGSKKYNNNRCGFRFIRVSDISKQVLEGVFVNEEQSKLVFCNKEDIIMALDGVPGVVNKGFEGAISSGIRIIKPKDSNISKVFLFYILQPRSVQIIIEKYTIGTTIKHASRAADFIKIPLPPLLEQKAIAEILSTVDSAIHKSDEIIAKTKLLKKGLMQELLTKGIGHEEFKDTEIGRIPKDWEILHFSKVLKLSSGKSRPANISEKPYSEMKFPVYGGNGILGYTNQYLTNIDSIVIGRVGEYCGSVYKSPKFSWITDNAIYAQEICLEVNLDFLTFFLIYLNLNQFKRESGQPLVTQEIIYSKMFVKPPLSEQQNISLILSTVDKKLELERKRNEKYELIKRGLMNDLLTGRKRINKFKESTNINQI